MYFDTEPEREREREKVRSCVLCAVCYTDGGHWSCLTSPVELSRTTLRERLFVCQFSTHNMTFSFPVCFQAGACDGSSLPDHAMLLWGTYRRHWARLDIHVYHRFCNLLIHYQYKQHLFWICSMKHFEIIRLEVFIWNLPKRLFY